MRELYADETCRLEKGIRLREPHDVTITLMGHRLILPIETDGVSEVCSFMSNLIAIPGVLDVFLKHGARWEAIV